MNIVRTFRFSKNKKVFFSRKKEKKPTEEFFDQEFIQDLILIPSLKFLQEVGDNTVGNNVREFLAHKDPKIRWNTLVLFDKLEIPIENKLLD